MKKLLALLLALVFCVAPLASCGGDETEGTGTGTETTVDTAAGEYDVKSATAFLKNMYKQYLTAPETTKDFTLVSQVMNDGVPYTVTWTSNSEDVKIVADDANKQVTVDVNEKTPTDINYELTATVADPAGATETLVFKLVIPACAFAPEEGTAYKFYLTQAIAGKVLYVDGGISGGRYLTMTDDFSKALDFFVEASGSGYKFFTTIDGAKKYVDIFTNDEGKTAVGFADSSDCVYSYNSATFAWEAEVDGVAYYLGTYSNYETVSASKTSYITAENTRVSQFPMEFTTEKVEFEGTTPPADEDPAPGDPNVVIGGTANADVVSAPKANTAYKLYFYQSKAGKVLYIDGGLNQDRYLTTTTDFAKALNVYAESANGGYKFYVTIDGAKKYVDVFTNDEGKIALRYADSTNCAFKYNKETFAWEVAVGEETYYLGTYNTFETVSASKTSYINKDNTRKEQFPLELVTKEVTVTPGSGNNTPTNPDTPKPPIDDKVPAADNGSYKLYIDQAKAKKILYIDGGIDQDRYLTMTEDYSKALTAKFEAVKGGYKISVTINGAKKYIDVYTNDAGKTAIRYAASTNCVFNENKTTKAWETTVDGTAYYLGTYNTFLTVSASKTSYITAENTGKEQFPLVKTTKEITPYPAETPVTPPVDNTTPAADNGTYRLYLDQVKSKKILYLDGGIDQERYLTMTDDYSKAIPAKFEAVKGGYKISVTINGAKKYIDVYTNDAGKTAIRYAASTNCVFNENKTTKAWETTVDGTAYYLGTYSTFNTVSASKTSYITAENTGKDQFPLVKTTKEITPYPAETPVTPPVNPNPGTGSVTAPTANKAYKLQTANSASTLYFSGEFKSGKLGATTDKSKAVDVYVEISGDKYYIYYMNAGVKTYIAAEGSGTGCFKTYTEKPASAWTFDSVSGAFISTDNERFIGSNKTNTNEDMRGFAKSNIENTAEYSIAKFVA